ncbi:putative methyltransferase C9orf114 homolog [Cimex lectularius]|uniref:RNA methyltransferase n=1 Tax=Cimex lectularius TaxID=79782 RepID=A0A8I6RGS3_CIMLE|nr:putative methyltransferase C9orf114 homolog [Cimex lectularius]
MGPVANAHLDWRKLREQKKKKKREDVEKYLLAMRKPENGEAIAENEEVVRPKTKNRLSIAVAGSILDNAQTQELQTYLVGQIARAATIFKVDEVIVYDDTGSTMQEEGESSQTWYNCGVFAQILQYLECPQYLRKHFFPMTEELRYAGLLNPLDAPHHLRLNQESFYREGVVLQETDKSGKHSYANIGLHSKVKLDRLLQPGLRVTVKLPTKSEETSKCTGIAVPPTQPKDDLGLYWGYEVRLAKSLGKVFTDCKHKKGYNLVIGTSDKGCPLDEVEFKKKKKIRALIVFGGLKGLEFALEQDKSLEVDDVKLLFDHYVNTCPNQGSRTIRTEEALLISLAVITDKMKF